MVHGEEGKLQMGLTGQMEHMMQIKEMGRDKTVGTDSIRNDNQFTINWLLMY